MKKIDSLRTRLYSLTIGAAMDGMLGFVILASPLFAIRLEADAWQLGALGWFSQAVRVPFTLFAGRLSDSVGRTRVIYPAALIGIVGCIGLAFSRNYSQVLVWYTCVMISMGGFYPALMAFIGDRSPQGELRRNLSFFNAGWASSSSICGLAVGMLLPLGPRLPFGGGAVLVTLAMVLVMLWARLPFVSASGSSEEADANPPPPSPGRLLVVARIGVCVTIFGFSAVASLFPKLGKDLGMSDSRVSIIVGMLLVGQATGILTSGASPWWRGKLWPNLLAQILTLLVSVVVFRTTSGILFGLSFWVIGTAVGVTYSSALYYSLQARSQMGKNTGIHESIAAVAAIAGNLAGGATAQAFSLRTPYLVMAGLAGMAVVVSIVGWGTRPGSK